MASNAQVQDFLRSLAENSPSARALPPGLQADSAYLAFQRGLGYTQGEALQRLSEARTQANAAFATQRPQIARQTKENVREVNSALGERGLWYSGERLSKVAKQRQLGQHAMNDLASARAQALQAAQQQYRGTISELSRQQAEQVGQLQARQAEQANQDKYLAALRGAAASSGPSYAPPTPPMAVAPPSSPSGGPAFPAQAPDQRRSSYFEGLAPQQKIVFANFIHAINPAGKNPLQSLAHWLQSDPLARLSPGQRRMIEAR